ncbi:MAG: hypothetical protein GY821_06860 [Gammaproteobacteria bacterium]|nr:hypothetical protein [Gammaproteobacteria bacterium]
MKGNIAQPARNRCVKQIIATVIATVILSTSSAYAAISEGAAKLISKGYTITNYQFTSEKKVTINTVKVTMLVHATVAPERLAGTLKQLKRVAIANAKFDLTTLAQNRTQTGLIQLSAQLTSEAPLTALPAIYQFAEQHSKSGTLYKVSTIVPYRSQADKQQTINQMAQALYQQANTYAKTAGSSYRIASINYRTPRYLNNNNQRPMPIMFAGTASRDVKSEAAPMLTMKEQISLSADVTFVSQGKK